jgi:hypothetical protein
MPEESKDKAEEREKLEKLPEYRRFKKLLRQVVKAPPLKRVIRSPEKDQA